jgi:hypothetical protein
VAWQGLSGPYADGVVSDRVIWLDQEVGRLVWTADGATRVVELNVVDEGADLALMATLRDGTVDVPAWDQGAPVPKAAILDLDRILGTFVLSQDE